jgi:hypothetical protein
MLRPIPGHSARALLNLTVREGSNDRVAGFVFRDDGSTWTYRVGLSSHTCSEFRAGGVTNFRFHDLLGKSLDRFASYFDHPTHFNVGVESSGVTVRLRSAVVLARSGGNRFIAACGPLQAFDPTSERLGTG